MTDFLTVLLIAVGLSADAFAVSISNSMTKPNLNRVQFLAYPICFGLFQGLMPLLGYFIGSAFSGFVEKVDHWIALILLAFIGGKMIFESIRDIKKKKQKNEEIATINENESETKKAFSFGEMILQGIATSIDAFVVGITLALTVNMNIFVSVSIITVATFVLSLVGMYLGKKVGKYLSDYSGIAGGIILVGIGVKIFIEHIIAL
ncbi:MAG TPA: manganese efflux pump MntP family protein [Clostridia bacterium]|nr:manganese efflux pump MntP family protein [Clostridia bacterium]